MRCVRMVPLQRFIIARPLCLSRRLPLWRSIRSQLCTCKEASGAGTTRAARCAGDTGMIRRRKNSGVGSI